MSNSNKKFNNGSRYSSNGEGSWAEGTQYQQNSPQTRKQSKYQNSKNSSNKYYSKNHYSYNNKSHQHHHHHQQQQINNDHRGNEISQRQQNNDSNAVVPNESNQAAYVTPVDQNSNECTLNINKNETNTETCVQTTEPLNICENVDNDQQVDAEQVVQQPQQNAYDQGMQQTFVPAQVPVTDIPNADISSCYNNVSYEYDYQQSNVQQQSQYYIYQPYQDYSQVPNMTGSPLNSSFTGNSQHQYYSAYQPIPSYIYDPQAGSYTSTYSPVQQSVHQNFQQTPGGTNLSSPQQQQQPSAFLASYQTPPQPAHQLYIQTSNITPPTSLSPNDTPSTNSSATTGTDRQSNCNSPHPTQTGMVPNHLTQTPVHNPYVMYNMDMSAGAVPQTQYSMGTNPMYTPMTPQTYQCNSPLPTPQFMMYNPPPMTHGSPFPTGSPNSPLMHTPYNASTNLNNFNHTPQKYNKYNRTSSRYNGNQSSQNNKRQFNNNMYSEHTPQSTYDENTYMNTPQSVPTKGAYEQEFVDPSNPETATMPPMYPSNPYCDPNMGMLTLQDIIANYHNNYENIESYGEDYDNYDDNGNGDDNDENLACKVCRGRRMCFCYFLKVRYYKFPSFFDLVDHQYKKWWRNERKYYGMNMIQQQQQMMASPNGCINQSQSNFIVQQSPNMAQTTSLPKKA